MAKNNETKYAVLNLSDWNMQDKYYKAPINLIKELKSKIKTIGISNAYKWWNNQVDYATSETKGRAIQYGNVNMSLDEYFLDFNDALESVDEWEF